MNWALDLVAHHPKLSQTIALTTTGVSGAAEYARQSMGLAPESWTEIGIIVGVFASVFVIYANYRRLRYDSEQNQLDAEIKQLTINKMQIENSNLEIEKENRRNSGEPLRRSTD